jgi:hypothetical protein
MLIMMRYTKNIDLSTKEIFKNKSHKEEDWLIVGCLTQWQICHA